MRWDDVSVAIGGRPVLRQVSMQALPGQILVVMGRTGSGKTTLLRAAAGLLEPSAGRISCDGKVLSDGLPPHRRDVAMMFQQDDLYPHLTIAQNIHPTSPLPWKRQAVSDQTRALANEFGIAELLDRRPHEISGGQRRRAGIVKCLASNRKIRFLDEPFAGLDSAVADETAQSIRRHVVDPCGYTVIVTHDPRHALAIADQIAVLDQGRCLQIGSPIDLRRRPHHRRVADAVHWLPIQTISLSNFLFDLRSLRSPDIASSANNDHSLAAAGIHRDRQDVWGGYAIEVGQMHRSDCESDWILPFCASRDLGDDTVEVVTPSQTRLRIHQTQISDQKAIPSDAAMRLEGLLKVPRGQWWWFDADGRRIDNAMGS